ncbi:necrosis and ethylene-inducing protein and ethylene inducing peptide [Plectosphaerella plurivora]|uniref:Necrosis and ethylene-inducing protein and ethylene inducing peptide n=1 Tax=Plectosphaerella plurivora TaxID=936078 RepID=A0A9P8V931_9PEZI|nr:necrosis and ethylene-inducing protein and ethylene inducing peptide [Plectosphaerella plurivora]
MLPTSVLSFLAFGAASLVQAQTWPAPGTVNHDSINPVPDALGPNGAIIRKFQPLLHIAHGCQPYSAVNKNNQISGGLQDSGTTAGGCKLTNKGQTYARTMNLNGRFGIMYAWYWPKDQPADGNLVSGHRHDWESSVVWLNGQNVNAGIVAGAASGHGNFKRTANPQRRGNNVKVEYFTSGGKNHELQFTNTEGRTYWIWDWDAMEPIVKSALNKGDFKSANCPFNDNNFANNMRAAF